MEGAPDSYTKDWPSASPAFLGCMLIPYLTFHYSYTPVPNLANFQKYKLLSLCKTSMVAAFNLIIFGMTVFFEFESGYSFFCQQSVREDKMLRICSLLYLWLKVFELSDTLIMALRGHEEVHIIVHHSLSLIVGWIGLRFIPVGTTSTLIAINSIEHFLLYSLLTVSFFWPAFGQEAFGEPIIRKIIPVVNNCQFLIIILVCGCTVQIGCGYSLGASLTVGFFAVFNLVLDIFANVNNPYVLLYGMFQ